MVEEAKGHLIDEGTNDDNDSTLRKPASENSHKRRVLSSGI
jgi:hypothetical protein